MKGNNMLKKVIITVMLAGTVFITACTPPGVDFSSAPATTGVYDTDDILRMMEDEFGRSCGVLDDAVHGMLGAISGTYGTTEFLALTKGQRDLAWDTMWAEAGPFTDRWIGECV